MGWKIQIIIEYDNLVFKQPEKVNEIIATKVGCNLLA